MGHETLIHDYPEQADQLVAISDFLLPMFYIINHAKDITNFFFKAAVEVLQQKCEVLEPVYDTRHQEFVEARNYLIELKDKMIVTNRQLRKSTDLVTGTTRQIKGRILIDITFGRRNQLHLR